MAYDAADDLAWQEATARHPELMELITDAVLATRADEIRAVPWAERIAIAEQTGTFTDRDVDLIGDFDCCFVGEQVIRGAISNDWDDALLEALGTAAASAVQRNQFRRAADLLDAIEDRALALKRGDCGPYAHP